MPRRHSDAAERVGSDRIRFTPYQKLVVLDVADDKVEELIADLAKLGLVARASNWRRNLMACSGIEFCKLSFTETRKRSQVLVPELDERLADINSELDVPITVNINGCPNSCARSQIADIGFKGQLVEDADGGWVADPASSSRRHSSQPTTAGPSISRMRMAGPLVMASTKACDPALN